MKDKSAQQYYLILAINLLIRFLPVENPLAAIYKGKNAFCHTIPDSYILNLHGIVCERNVMNAISG